MTASIVVCVPGGIIAGADPDLGAAALGPPVGDLDLLVGRLTSRNVWWTFEPRATVPKSNGALGEQGVRPVLGERGVAGQGGPHRQEERNATHGVNSLHIGIGVDSERPHRG